MNLTALTLLGLATGLGQSPTPPAESVVPVTNKKTFPIPVEVKPNRRAEIRWLELWASRDGGQLWEIFDQQKNDQETLTFKDKGDGLYWVNMVIKYNDGRLEPPDVSRVVPAMKVVIDTVPPVVTVTSASRAGEDIVVEWTVDDKNPNDGATAVYVRSSATADSQWQQAPPDAVQKRSARFKTKIAGGVVVMVVTADQARNAGSASKEIAGGTTAGYSPPEPAPTPGPMPPAQPPVLNQGGPLPPPSGTPDTGGGPLPVAPLNIRPLPSDPPAAPVQPPSVGVPPGQPPAVAPAEPYPPYQPTPVPSSPPAVPTGPQPLRTLGPGADSLPPPALQPAGARQPMVEEVPTAQVIRTPRFDLGYQVDGGVSGVAKIVLYVTRDDGRSWTQWSVHDGKESPLKVVLDNPRLNRDVEGDYGFRLVPVSGAGLSDPAPAPGTPPEMKVRVDVTPPVVDIFAPQADPKDRNALVLIWKATDKNFGREPIQIDYAETLNGPWKSVAAGDPTASAGGRLANTGSYSWAIPATLSTPQVYLRVTAWDLGGIKTERVTERPILVDLTRPRATIQGIVGSPGR
jgi:hypothetical protein